MRYQDQPPAAHEIFDVEAHKRLNKQLRKIRLAFFTRLKLGALQEILEIMSDDRNDLFEHPKRVTFQETREYAWIDMDPETSFDIYYYVTRALTLNRYAPSLHADDVATWKNRWRRFRDNERRRLYRKRGVLKDYEKVDVVSE